MGASGGEEKEISGISDQEAGIEERNSKSEIRKAKREARPNDCAGIPPPRRSARGAQIALRDAPESGAEEKSGSLRSLLRRAGGMTVGEPGGGGTKKCPPFAWGARGVGEVASRVVEAAGYLVWMKWPRRFC